MYLGCPILLVKLLTLFSESDGGGMLINGNFNQQHRYNRASPAEVQSCDVGRFPQVTHAKF